MKRAKKFLWNVAGVVLLSLMCVFLASCSILNAKIKYTLYFKVNDEVYATIDTSGHEAIQIPEDPEMEGYTFEGWFWDNNEWTRPFTANSLLNEPLTNNMSVFAKFVENHEHTFSELWTSNGEYHWHAATCDHGDEVRDKAAHTFDEEGNCSVCGYNKANATYTVTFNGNGGTLVSGTEVQTVAYLGSAIAPVYTREGYIFIGFDKDYTSVTEDILVNAQWSEGGKQDYDMSKVVFADQTVTYDGDSHSIYATNLPEGVSVSYVNNGQVNAGTYEVIAKFTGDTNNYNPIPDKTATLTINKATVNMASVVFNDKNVTYNGNSHSIYATNLPEGVSVSYVNNGQVNAGTYEVIAKFTGDTNNYNAIPDKTATLTINKATYNMSGVSFDDDTVVYDGKKHNIVISALPTGVTVEYSVNGKSFTGATNVGEYEIVARFNGDYDNYNAISDKTATLTINKATYNMSGVSFDDDTVVYDGKKHNIVISALPTGVTVEYSVNGKAFAGATNVGEYEIVAKFNGDYDNYNAIPDKTATLTINKATYNMSGVKFEDNSHTYDGQKHNIVISALPTGVTVEYSVNGKAFAGATDAGKYDIVARFNGDYTNYNVIPDMTATLTIKKADYDMSGVKFEDKSYTYNGQKRNIVIYSYSLPDGVSVKYYVDGEEFSGATDAGIYDIVAVFNGDKNNYNAISNKTATLTIEKATINLDSVMFKDDTVPYDGEIHSITVQNLPSELSADDITYYYNNQQLDGVSAAGVYTVIATFNVSDNYYAVGNLQATLTIKERESYADKYAQYGVLGKTIDMINATEIETLSGAKNVFKDELFYIDVYREDLGKQVGVGKSYSSMSETMSDFSASMDLKVAFGSRTNKNGTFLTNKVPSFNIEASGSYTKDKKNQTNEYYYTYNWIKSGYRVDINGYKDPSQFQGLLSDELIQDAVKVRNGTLTPEQFISFWGTHVIMSAIYGEKVEVSYASIANHLEDKTKWTADLDAEFNRRFLKTELGVNLSVGASSITSSVTSNAIQNLIINVRSKQNFSETSIDEFTSSYQKWLSDHKDGIDYSVFSDVPDGSLYCIWHLLGEEYNDVIQIMDTYMLGQCSAFYQEKLKAINSYSLPDDLEFDEETKTLSINLNCYQESGSIVNFNGHENFDGVLNLTPYRDGKEIEKIVINGAYGTRNSNDGKTISTLINGFTLSFDKDWYKDIDIVLNNVGVYTASEKGFIDISAVEAAVNLSITYNGTNIIDARFHAGAPALVLKGISITDAIIKSSDSSAILKIYGGDGANGVAAGANGQAGGCGIIAENLTIDINGTLLVKGGNGGDGAKGEDSNVQGAQGDPGIGAKENGGWDANGTDGGKGYTGGTGGAGGRGGDGAAAICTRSFLFVDGNVTLTSGNGGKGAQGGKGGKGGTGGTGGPDNWGGWGTNIPGNGGPGGKGGTGGTGGDGGNSKNPVINPDTNAALDIPVNEHLTIIYGVGGTPGEGGAGGDPGEGGAGGSGGNNGGDGGPGGPGEYGDPGAPGKRGTSAVSENESNDSSGDDSGEGDIQIDFDEPAFLD